MNDASNQQDLANLDIKNGKQNPKQRPRYRPVNFHHAVPFQHFDHTTALSHIGSRPLPRNLNTIKSSSNPASPRNRQAEQPKQMVNEIMHIVKVNPGRRRYASNIDSMVSSTSLKNKKKHGSVKRSPSINQIIISNQMHQKSSESPLKAQRVTVLSNKLNGRTRNQAAVTNDSGDLQSYVSQTQITAIS